MGTLLGFMLLSEVQLMKWYNYCFLVPSAGNTDVASTSCSTSNVITAVVSCVVSFIIGALVGAVAHYCTVRKKSNSHSISHKEKKQQPVPVYEDVISPSHNNKLKENAAYGPVQQ